MATWLLVGSVLFATWRIATVLNKILFELTAKRLLDQHIAGARGFKLPYYDEDLRTLHSGITSAESLQSPPRRPE